MAKTELVQVPQIIAGIQTIRCCECDYETTVIIPEEAWVALTKILEHIQQHGITIPNFTVETL